MAAGDFYIRRNSADNSVVPNAGSNEDAGFDTVVRDIGSIVTYTDPNFQLDIGHYLIMYSEYFDTTNITNNERIEIQGEIHVSGVIGGWGQGYMRKASGDQECVVRGSHFLEVTANNTNVFIRFYRTDNSTSGTVNRVPGNGSVIILELADTDNFGYYNNGSVDTCNSTESSLQIDNNIRQDSTFTRTGTAVDIAIAGRYLVSYSMNLNQAGTGREGYRAHLELDGVPANGTYSYCYLRGIDGCQDGALTWCGIIDVAAGQNLELRHISPNSNGIATIGVNLAVLQIWQIPNAGDECIIEATTGAYDNATTGFVWDTLPVIDVASFTHIAGNSNLDIDQRDHILAFATFSQAASDAVQRGVPFARFQLDDIDLNYMCGDVYHRNSGSEGAVAVTVAGIIHDTLANSSIEVSTIARAVSGQMINDSAQFSTLSLEALYGGYLYLPAITDFNTVEKFNWGDTNLIITGIDFEAIQGIGIVEIWSDNIGTIKVSQSINSWSATSIEIDTIQGGLPTNSLLYLVITTNGGLESIPFSITEGLIPYHALISDTLKADHYWRLNNVYDDIGDTGPVRDMTSAIVGTWTFSDLDVNILSDSNSHSLNFNAVADRREIVDSPNMNVTIDAAERTIACWFQMNNIQQPFAAIWKEGGGVQNLAFIVGMGNVLLAQMADTPGNAGNVQAWSDITLTPNRPYHICMRYSLTESPRQFRLYLDGEEQTDTDGNDMPVGSFNSHSGDVTWNDPDNNLETGGTDISYNGLEDAQLSDFCTWSDNSAGTNAGALDKITEIRDILFRRGARPKYTITADIEINMQSDLDAQLTNIEVEDWPLGIRIEAPSSGGPNLELISDNITFNSRTTLHLEWRGTGTLTWVNTNGSIIDSSKIFASNGGIVIIEEAAKLTISGLTASEVRVYIAGTTTELGGSESVTGSFILYVRENSVDVRVVSTLFVIDEFYAVNTTTEIEIPVDQRIDRNFYNP